MRHVYDHRLRELVCQSGDLELARDLGVPRSTAASWLRRGARAVITASVMELDEVALRARVLRLERRVRQLLAIVRLLYVLVRVSGLRLEERRLPDGNDKRRVLEALRRAREVVSLGVALRVLGLSRSRYQGWKRSDAALSRCELDDSVSCPRTQPQRITSAEHEQMREMVTGEDYRHMSLRQLALHAQRVGRIFAHPATWMRAVRRYGWLRPRKRVYPPRPKVGVRASRPGELVHIDVTIFRLLDGSRAYLHAVIDNFSRRILAWRVADRLEPGTTCSVLAGAASELAKLRDAGESAQETTLLADSGVENVNGAVDDLLSEHPLRRVLAQVEVAFSNSMIEAWWKSLKHHWVYLHALDSVGTLEKLVAFYVDQHNAVMPHAAFQGATPDEIFFGRDDGLAERLAAGREQARAARIATNRALTCADCHGRDPPTVAEEAANAA